MIINTGGRTDTVHYYSDWLLKRFEEGYVLVRNPLFPNKVSHYELTPDKVDCVVFCSKNYRPILKGLHNITDRFNTYFHYTITAYEKDIEPTAPKIEKSIETLQQLSAQVGKQRIAWRYDPVLLTEKYTVEYHLATFEKMAKAITPYVDRCIFSFVEMYKKLDANMPEIILLREKDKQRLAKGFGETVRRYGLYLQTCATEGDFSIYGIHASGCMTLDMLGRANDVAFKTLKHSGSRQHCGCIETRDIGAYDSCPTGCKYCYANKSPTKAREMHKLHDPNWPLLIGHLNTTDVVTHSNQKSLGLT
ncbi:hypothetical protein BKK47_00485 [Rodentibacter mrazii]|uniref:DUF1848 domain-containing protein n=1 Tax=Rodentibacter mrazii TaxID=1908257 RepID=A0A1V3IKR2_9PAST|nr:DUF1848 domain-containing protein [Rodentibacter mrazii]OOF41682.1 hypothetical protein BKK47_00485 [Rodentibacter mrazii]